MKLCIFGAGAIGGYLGVKLARAGVEVSLVARGPNLEAIRKNGLTLVSEGQTDTVTLPASSNPADLGPAIKRAIEVVKRGEPSLIDVVTQPR